MTDDLLRETLAQPVCIGELCIYCSPFSQFFSTDIIKKTRLKMSVSEFVLFICLGKLLSLLPGTVLLNN